MLLTAGPEGDDARWLAPVSAIAAIVLGRALQIADGSLDPGALRWVVVALTLMIGAAIVRRPRRLASLDRWALPAIAGAGVLVQLVQLYSSSPGIFLRRDPALTAIFRYGLAGFAVIGAALVYGPSQRIKWSLIGALVAIHFAIGASIMSHSPKSIIDVDVFHRQSISALLAGVNPYAITFPNIYSQSNAYGPGMVVDDRLQFGFPYPPATLLLSLPGTILGSDHRYAALVAMELAAVLMALARPGGFGALAAVLYLTSPRIFYVLQMSWTEPLVVFGLAVVVFAACRNNRAVPWLFGAFLGLKQYLVLALPAALLLVPPPRDRRSVLGWLTKAAIVPLAVTLPFFLWSPSAFLNSVVTLQFRQPFRPDSLSVLAWWASLGHPQLSSAIAFATAALASACAVRWLPRTAAGFSAAIAVTFLAFFAFNKQAFCNYYFFVVGALCMTLAAGAPPPKVASKTSNKNNRLLYGTRRVRAVAEGLWRLRERLALAALVLASVVPLLWPGDAPFINDEPLLLASAAMANAADRLADLGLTGTFGFTYGPAPVWCYQLLLGVTHDLVRVALLHTLLLTATTATALWWLSRSLRLWVWFAPIPLLSPYFWFYARALWDNPFLIPLGALAMAGYAAHLDSGSKAGLRVSLVAIAAIPLVHLMGIALVLPLATHMVLVRWRVLWAHRVSVLAVGAAVLALAWPYWKYLATSLPPARGAESGLQGWLFPLLGGQLLSTRGLEYFFGAVPLAGAVLRAAALLSWLAYALVWGGIAIAVWRLITAARQGQWTPRAHIATILVASVGCQMVLDGLSGKYQHPHYQNGTWITVVLLAWFAIDAIASRQSEARWGAPAATSLLAAVLLTTVGTVAFRLHRSSGTRAIYGPTIVNQQAVARTLASYSPQSRVSTSVGHYDLYPQALAALRQLNRPRGNGPARQLEVRYASQDPTSGAIEVVER